MTESEDTGSLHRATSQDPTEEVADLPAAEEKTETQLLSTQHVEEAVVGSWPLDRYGKRVLKVLKLRKQIVILYITGWRIGTLPVVPKFVLIAATLSGA